MEYLECWEKITPTLKDFYTKDLKTICNPQSYMFLYTTIFNFLTVSFNKENKLEFIKSQYILFYMKISDFIEDQIKNIENVDLLSYSSIWENFKRVSIIIDHIFVYFNKSYIEKLPLFNQKFFHIKKLSFILFNKVLIEKYNISLNDTIFKKFNNYRADEYEEFQDISKFIDSLKYISSEIDVDIFETRFKNQYLENLEFILSSFSCSNLNIDQIIYEFDKMICMEQKLYSKLFTDLNDDVDKKLFDSLIQKNIDTIEKNFNILQFNNSFKSIYYLFNKFKCNQELSKLLMNRFRENFRIIKDDTNYLDKSFDIFNDYKEIILKYFNNDQSLFRDLELVFKKEYNSNDKLCLILAKSIDSCIKKGDLDNKGFDQKINFIDSYELFIKYYQKFMARRLLNNLNKDIIGEEEMISVIKRSLGQYNIYQLENMINDIKYSKITHSDNKKINCYILKSNIWPIKTEKQIILPSYLNKYITSFEKQYLDKYSGRKLTWNHSISNGILETTFLDKKYIFMVNTEQMAILLLFNDNICIRNEDILSNLGINEDKLKNIIKPLLEVKLLFKTDDKYSLNLEYKSNSLKKNLLNKVNKPKKKEIDDVNKSYQIELDYVVQSYLVKIMKSRKTLDHNNLVSECIKMSTNKYKINIPIIKKNISILIEKEYIERKNLTEYNYLA